MEFFKIKRSKYLAVKRFYTVVAQVAYRPFMGMVYAVDRFKISLLYSQAHLLIHIAERNPIESQAVDLLDREHETVARIFEYLRVHRHLPYHPRHHSQDVDQ